MPNPDDGSNYMDGVYWHVYKVPEIEYWKNAGSVRTTKYEGSYSLLMRNEGIYLTQSLGNLLKSNTYYKISYYHRSSTVAQGGSSYQIELGSTEFGTDGGVFRHIRLPWKILLGHCLKQKYKQVIWHLRGLHYTA